MLIGILGARDRLLIGNAFLLELTCESSPTMCLHMHLLQSGLIWKLTGGPPGELCIYIFEVYIRSV